MTGGADADPRERDWMAQALALGALAEGRTSPNPRVGCLLVRDGRVVGRGWHQAPGEPHAEALAVAEAGERARGATLYVNLEPCAHQGRTPPCTGVLIPHGLRRVVAAIQDPNPRVDGKGFEELRRAGIEVSVGVLAAEARRLNEPFIHWHLHGLPLVTLKAAASSDGMLSGAGGASRWITGPAARRVAHRLRARHDAILVGAETVRRDDPRLNVRLAGREEPRLRVVVSRSLRLDPAARVFAGPDAATGGRTRVYTGPDASPRAERRLRAVAEVVRLRNRGPEEFLAAVLDDLGALGVQSVLVEGGARTLGSFLSAGLAQRFALFCSSRILGTRGGTPLVDLPSVEDPATGWGLQRDRIVPLGEDLLLLGRLTPPSAAPGGG